MSTPSLHSASVATSVPSASTIASPKKSAGCWAQTRSRVRLMASIKVEDVGLAGTAGRSRPRWWGRGCAGPEGIEIDLVVAAQFDVFEAAAAGEDVEGDVQDVVGFVIGEMALEQMEVGVDGGDQAGAACQQEHGADAAGGEAVDALAEFVVDVAGGDHGAIAFGFGAIGDAVEDSPLASSQFVQDTGIHSKASVAWQ